MVAVSTYYFSKQGPNLAFIITFLRCAASTYSLSAFASYSFANLCVMAIVHIFTLTSAYLYCSSRALVSSLYRLGSSCRLINTLSAYLKSTVQSFTTVSTVATTSLKTVSCCSLNSSGVEGRALNSSSMIIGFS